MRAEAPGLSMSKNRNYTSIEKEVRLHYFYFVEVTDLPVTNAAGGMAPASVTLPLSSSRMR